MSRACPAAPAWQSGSEQLESRQWPTGACVVCRRLGIWSAAGSRRCTAGPPSSAPASWRRGGTGSGREPSRGPPPSRSGLSPARPSSARLDSAPPAQLRPRRPQHRMGRTVCDFTHRWPAPLQLTLTCFSLTVLTTHKSAAGDLFRNTAGRQGRPPGPAVSAAAASVRRGAPGAGGGPGRHPQTDGMHAAGCGCFLALL